jgi:hypothetical protein
MAGNRLSRDGLRPTKKHCRSTDSPADSCVDYEVYEAFNRNDAAAVAALHTEDGFHAFKKISSRRPAIEKSYAIDFQAWHPSNRVITGDRLKAVGNDRVERTLARKQLLPRQTRAVARRHHEHTARILEPPVHRWMADED